MTAKKYFGTDGIRGKANGTLTPGFVLRLGQALGTFFKTGERRHHVVIGKDTRLSGYMIEFALASGFASVGMDVILVGPLPTAAVAMITRTTRADAGIEITASHNPYEDNGIKVFSPDGNKLSDEAEALIEHMLDPCFPIALAPPHLLGRVRKDETNRARYVQFAKMTVLGLSLEGLRIALDCANGAAYRSATETLSELGAEIVSIGVEPDGFNINRECGSTSLGALRKKVLEVRANVGIAFDGDADRVIFVDESGKIVDGDQLLAALAGRWKETGRLDRGGIVGTVMSNIGLERHLNLIGISLERTSVGDHHVLECMRTTGYVLGGEPSGHIIITLPNNFGTVADGLVTALQVLAVLKKDGRKASEVLHCFDRVPQVLENVQTSEGKKVLADPLVLTEIDVGQNRIGDRGRLSVRASGTEPVIRVMVECDDQTLAKQVVDQIASVIRKTNI